MTYCETWASPPLVEIAETLLPGPTTLHVSDLAPAQPAELVHRYLATRGHLRFRVGAAANRCDTYLVAPWLLMAVVDVGCIERFQSPLSGQDIVEFHFRLSGSIELNGTWGEVAVREPAWLLWYQPKGCNDAAERVGDPGRARESWVSLYCDRAALLELCATAAPRLADVIAGQNGTGDVPRFRISTRIGLLIPVLREIVQARPDEPLHWMLTSAKAHELLYLTLRSADTLLEAPASGLRLTQRDRRGLAQARDLLAAQYATPPALADLARRVGLNPTKLCCGFRQQFGESTSAFVRRRRMEEARGMLSTSGAQVRQVARAVGYSHHSTFTAAFARHFGVAPKAVRGMELSAV